LCPRGRLTRAARARRRLLKAAARVNSVGRGVKAKRQGGKFNATPPAIWIDVKQKELQEKGFITL
jgi:hypothetical protein